MRIESWPACKINLRALRSIEHLKPVRPSVPAQDVDCEHAQPGLALDVHDGEHRLVQDGVAHVLARLRVGRHLRQDVVHRLRGLGVVLAEDAEKAKDFNLEKGREN